MVNRSAAASAALLLLVVARVCSAFIVTPEVVLMRVKRDPEPMRSFSFSGFDPNGQMAAFTGMAGGYPTMYGTGYGAPPHATAYHYGPPQGQDSYGQSTQDSYGPPPTGADQQQNSPKQQYGGGPQRPGDTSEQLNNSVEQTDATAAKKQYKGRDGPSSNAEASFNAWFPIMFGVFPNGAGGNGGGQLAGANTAGRGNDQGQQGQPGPNANSFGAAQNNGGYERSSGSTTVIANSVSNGRHGVATSHAIAYGNPRSSSRK